MDRRLTPVSHICSSLWHHPISAPKHRTPTLSQQPRRASARPSAASPSPSPERSAATSYPTCSGYRPPTRHTRTRTRNRWPQPAGLATHQKQRSHRDSGHGLVAHPLAGVARGPGVDFLGASRWPPDVSQGRLSVPIIRSWALTRGFSLHPGTRNRYEIRYTRTQHRPASRQVNDHGRVSGTHRVVPCADQLTWCRARQRQTRNRRVRCSGGRNAGNADEETARRDRRSGSPPQAPPGALATGRTSRAGHRNADGIEIARWCLGLLDR